MRFKEVIKNCLKYSILVLFFSGCSDVATNSYYTNAAVSKSGALMAKLSPFPSLNIGINSDSLIQDSHFYFILEVTANGTAIEYTAPNPDAFNDAMTYFHGPIASDIRINDLSGNDIIIQYIRSVNPQISSQIVMAVEKGLIKSDEIVIDWADDFFLTGTHTFKFSRKKIEDIK